MPWPMVIQDVLKDRTTLYPRIMRGCRRLDEQDWATVGLVLFSLRLGNDSSHREPDNFSTSNPEVKVLSLSIGAVLTISLIDAIKSIVPYYGWEKPSLYTLISVLFKAIMDGLCLEVGHLSRQAV